MQTALKNNKVLLWGLEVVPEDKLKPYDIGNKNPLSLKQIGKAKGKKKDLEGQIIEVNDVEEEEEKERKPTDVFDNSETYTRRDIPFLEKELKRLSKEKDDLDEKQEETIDLDEINELGDMSERIDIIIEDIKYLLKELSKDEYEESIPEVKPSKSKKDINGKGFKKGSPEAIAHAQKMREKLAQKKAGIVETPKENKETKRRVIKGSEEAKEIGRKLAEAKKAKQTPKAKEIEAVEAPKREVQKKPWYYIGDIPPRYRAATMDEAIKNNKVSKYGKYQVDETKYKYYTDYGILLSYSLSDSMILAQTSGIKRRIQILDDKINRLDVKADKESDNVKKSLVLWEIKESLEERKGIIRCYNWLMDEYYKRQGKIHTKETFERKIEKIKEIKKIKEKPIIKEAPKEEKPKKQPKKSSKEMQAELAEIFEKDGKEIRITKDYFDSQGKLLSDKAKELFDMGVMLDKSMYHLNDYKSLIFVPKYFQVNDILEDVLSGYKEMKAKKPRAKKETLKGRTKQETLKGRTKQEEKEYFEAREKEAYERAEKEANEKKNNMKLSTKDLEEIFNSVQSSPKKSTSKVRFEEPEKPKKKAPKTPIKTETMELSPEMEEKYNIVEYLNLEPEDMNDADIVEMAKSNNDIRAKQIEKLSNNLGVIIIDPNIK